MPSLKPLLLAFLIAPAGVWAQCKAPQAPEIPDGGTASQEEMLETQQAIKDFQAENKDYMGCLGEDIDSTAAVANDEEASDEERAEAAKRHQEVVEQHNAAVNREEELANEFNNQVQAYQEQN